LVEPAEHHHLPPGDARVDPHVHFAVGELAQLRVGEVGAERRGQGRPEVLAPGDDDQQRGGSPGAS
jgi:hypothetical protein